MESLLIRGTFGTSYRAPNLRELFLQDQTGFLTLFDPCFIPEEALDDLTGEYIPELDARDQATLDNCDAQGVDPTRAENNGFNSHSVELAEGGAGIGKGGISDGVAELDVQPEGVAERLLPGETGRPGLGGLLVQSQPRAPERMMYASPRDLEPRKNAGNRMQANVFSSTPGTGSRRRGEL